MAIEVEIRTFLTQEQYEHLLAYFHKEATFHNDDYQETYYFDGTEDLRIQKNNTYAKIWLKKGKLHDDAREEIELRIDTNAFTDAEQLFTALGYNVHIKWYRTRHTFTWQGISVMLDSTKGYGYILELEKMSTEHEKDAALALLHQQLQTLNIRSHPKKHSRKNTRTTKNTGKNSLNKLPDYRVVNPARNKTYLQIIDWTKSWKMLR